MCDQFENILTLSQYLEENYDFSHTKSLCFYQFYKLCQARALLHTGNISEALELFHKIRVNPFPPHLRHFMQMNSDLIKLDFLLFQHKIEEARKLQNEIKSLAEYTGYKFFIQKAFQSK